MDGTTFIPDSAQDLNAFVTVIALVVGAAQVLFLFNVGWSIVKGKKSGPNPWRAASLEWQTPQTPPGHGNFDTLPVVYRWAYGYGVPGAKEDYVPQNLPPDHLESDYDNSVLPQAAAQPAE